MGGIDTICLIKKYFLMPRAFYTICNHSLKLQFSTPATFLGIAVELLSVSSRSLVIDT